MYLIVGLIGTALNLDSLLKRNNTKKTISFFESHFLNHLNIVIVNCYSPPGAGIIHSLKMSLLQQTFATFVLVSCVLCVLLIWYMYLTYSGDAMKQLVPNMSKVGFNWTPHLQLSKSVIRSDKTRDHLNTGYVLALSYKDQITSSSHRLVSLSCWAKQWNMTVVSPFVSDTFFRVPLPAVPTTTTAMKYDEIFNISKWNAYCEEHSLSPFAPWEDFLQNAPREVVLVDLVYNRYIQKQCDKTVFGNKECNFQLLKYFWSQMLAPHQFRVVKEICIDLNQHLRHDVTMEDLNLLFWGNNSDYPPNSVSLVMNEWNGIAYDIHRKTGELMECHIDVNTTNCLSFPPESKNMVYKLLSPSSRLFHDAEMFVSKYLSQSNSYVAVMVRWEWAGMQRVNHNSVVIQNIVKEWQRQENTTGIFLTTDIGKYGSVVLAGNHHIETLTKELFKTLYGKVISLEDYSRRFEDVSNSTHPGYISQLQRVIAAKARCLLMVGGGHFQQQTLKLYNELHGEQIQRSCFKTL